MVSGFWAGVVLGPIGVLLAIASSPHRAGQEELLLKDNLHRKCPDCAEIVKAEAKICRYCGNELPKLPAPAPRAMQIRNPY